VISAKGVAGVGRKAAELGAEKLSSPNRERDGQPSSDVIDLDYLRRFTLGNTALEEEVLRLFHDQAPLYLEQLCNATSAKAWAEAAHTIKGSGAAIGARRLASIAEMVERLDIESAAARDEGFRAQAIEAVTGAMEEVRRCIDRLLERR
jgi:HPt (histidine-containing phosphotransfer) domain-containing protein